MTAIRPNLFKLLAPLATLACGLALFLALNRTGDIEPPAGAAGAAVDVPAGASTDQRIAILQGAARNGLVGAEGYAQLGDAYLDKARENGDPAYYSRAGRSFDAALRRDARNVTGVLGAGTLAGLRHEFHQQLRLGREAQRLEPGLAAFPVIADAQIELGRYAAAARTIQRMLDVKPNLDVVLARVVLPRAVAATPSAPSRRCGWRPPPAARPRTPPTCRCSWATSSFNAAVSAPPARPTSVRCDRCRTTPRDWSDSHELTRRAAIWGEPPLACVGPSTRLPLISTLGLLAQVERRLGHRAAAAAALDTAARAAGPVPCRGHGARRRVRPVRRRSRARAAAVALGRRVWAAAPSVRSADALGWALTRAGRPAAGYRWALRALALGSRDASFRLHAGIAARRAGLAAAAARHLAIAAAARPALTPDGRALLQEAGR